MGVRFVNLLTSAYRVWVRYRRRDLITWEAQVARPYFAFTHGTGVVDTVFRQTLRAEAQTTQKGHYVIILWGLKEYYENIDRRLLLGRAGRTSYPMYLMKPVLEMYKK